MSRQVIWTDKVLQTFIKEANLSDDEILIMTTRAKGWTITKQAMTFNMSEQKIHRMIAILKKKYDEAQKHNQDIMPPRKFSVSELYMDRN